MTKTKIQEINLKDYYFPETNLTWKAFSCWYINRSEPPSLEKIKEKMSALKSIDAKIVEWFDRRKVGLKWKKKGLSSNRYIVSKEIVSEFASLVERLFGIPPVIEEKRNYYIVRTKGSTGCTVNRRRGRWGERLTEYFNSVLAGRGIPVKITEIITTGAKGHVANYIVAYPKYEYSKIINGVVLVYVTHSMKDKVFPIKYHPIAVVEGENKNKENVIGVLYTHRGKTRLVYTRIPG